MRVIGMDVHRPFAQVAILEEGKVMVELRLDLVRAKVLAFGRTLHPDDEVVLEAGRYRAAAAAVRRPGHPKSRIEDLMPWRFEQPSSLAA
jgi:transposase